jgi:hypothetical protein
VTSELVSHSLFDRLVGRPRFYQSTTWLPATMSQPIKLTLQLLTLHHQAQMLWRRFGFGMRLDVSGQCTNGVAELPPQLLNFGQLFDHELVSAEPRGHHSKRGQSSHPTQPRSPKLA